MSTTKAHKPRLLVKVLSDKKRKEISTHVDELFRGLFHIISYAKDLNGGKFMVAQRDFRKSSTQTLKNTIIDMRGDIFANADNEADMVAFSNLISATIESTCSWTFLSLAKYTGTNIDQECKSAKRSLELIIKWFVCADRKKLFEWGNKVVLGTIDMDAFQERMSVDFGLCDDPMCGCVDTC